MIPHPSKPAWAGPTAGITQSLLVRFLECPFRFYLYAYCGLAEAVPLNLNLIWGDTLHKGLEHLLSGSSLSSSISLMREYQHTNYPTAPATFEHTTAHMLALYPLSPLQEKYGPLRTEVKFSHEMKLDYKSILPYAAYTSLPKADQYVYEFSRIVLFRGKMDFLSDPPYTRILGDHKAKGRTYPMETNQDLVHDLQMNLYAYISERENWLYDLIQIPEEAYRVPERTRESPADWANLIFNKYNDTANGFPIKNQVRRWICQIPHYKPMAAIYKYFQFTIAPIVHRLCLWWEHVTHPNFDPNDPVWYNHVFYQSPARLFDPSRTDKFKPHFHSILTEQADYSSLVPVKSFYSELE